MKIVWAILLVALFSSEILTLKKKVVRKLQREEDAEEIQKEEEGEEHKDDDGPKSINDVKDFECKHTLLYSYGILSSTVQKEPSKLCGDASVGSCCSKVSEEVILDFWKNNNKMKIKHYIESYVWLFKAILNHYQLYKTKAQKIIEFPGSPKVCTLNAENFIATYIDKNEIDKYTTRLIKVFENLAFTRKAFYCSLCNSDYQKFFNVKEKTITYSKKFCENLVDSTLEDLYTRNHVYMDIFNSMSVIAECDPEKEYQPETYSVDMKLHIEDQNRMDKCYESYVTKDQKDPRVFFDDCEDFCGAYSISHATEMFEGNFAKLYFLFRKIRQFKESLNIKQIIFEQVNVMEEYDFGRVSPEFFKANLKQAKFENFSINWDRKGVELFYIASKSKNFFGSGSSKIFSISVAWLFLLALFLQK